MEEGIKQCTQCKRNLPETEQYYYVQNHKDKDGNIIKSYLAQPCRECRKNYQRGYVEENREQHNESSYSWFLNNREHNNAMCRKNYRETKVRRYHYKKKWDKNNPDKLSIYKEQHRDHDISEKEWRDCKEYFNNKCAYCELHINEHLVVFRGKLIHSDFHREHVYHDGANDLSNCVPSCKTCNTSKHAIDFEFWYRKRSENYTEERYNKIIKWLQEDHKQYIQQDKKPKRKYKIKDKTK
jgi:hypothetical protein